MQLEGHVQAIQTDLARAAGLGDEATAEAARRLSEALGSTLHLRLLDALGERQAEPTSRLRPGLKGVHHVSHSAPIRLRQEDRSGRSAAPDEEAHDGNAPAPPREG